MEEWRDIPGYEGLYEASTHGNIRSKEGKITSNKRYAERRWKSRVMKGRGDFPSTGRRVSLWKDGQNRDFLVARLVALTFHGTPPENFTVNHKDGNRLNNRADNLEWLSLGDNIRHGFESGLYHSQKAITLTTGETVHSFRSLSQCDRFLGRCVGYTSGRLVKRKAIRDKQGNIYTIA